MGFLRNLLREIGEVTGLGGEERAPPLNVNLTNKIILGLVNRERWKRKLTPVVFSPDMEYHAHDWSRKMAKDKRLSHSGKILENCCMCTSFGGHINITKRMFRLWQKSPPHWNWMMNPRITRAGFAFTKRGNYAYGAYAFR